MSFQIRKERTSASTQPWLSYNAYVSQQLIAIKSTSTVMAESQAAKQVGRPTKRVLACIQCQQRKIKCDRNFPCSNCNRFRTTCIPANSLPPKARRKRFPERELLDRLQQYEELLRKNNITFNAMHATSPPDNSTTSDSPEKDDNGIPQSKEALYGLTLESDDDDDDEMKTQGSEDIDHEAVIRAYTNRFAALHWPSLNSNDHLLFGVPTEADLSNLHPPQAHMFRLWQVYLDNVNPLLKITHTPTLQPRIIDAMSNIAAVDSHLEALIFSIYCIAVVTLSHDECIAYFQCSRVNLLIIFHNACQQALLKCGIWQVGSDDGLTALTLYLV
ncbi:hypothetical protein MRB53_041683 [Persea americana]|nr:hypothetical protein MRB53_041683 [Persea americana]